MILTMTTSLMQLSSSTVPGIVQNRLAPYPFLRYCWDVVTKGKRGCSSSEKKWFNTNYRSYQWKKTLANGWSQDLDEFRQLTWMNMSLSSSVHLPSISDFEEA